MENQDVSDGILSKNIASISSLDESADSGDELPKLIYPRTFNIGDVVWGQTRGYPSWPGKLVDETAVKGNHHKTELGKVRTIHQLKDRHVIRGYLLHVNAYP